MWSWIFLLSLVVSGSLGEDRSKRRRNCLNVGSSAGGVGENKPLDLENGFIPPSTTEDPHWVNCELPTTTQTPNNNGNGNGNGNGTECGSEADIVFLLDTSGSVGMANFNVLLQFVQNLVQRFTIGPNDIQIGIDVFSTFVTSEFNLNTYDNSLDIVSAIGNITYRGGQTNIADSIDFMVNDSFSAASGNRPGIPKVGIIITDGGSDDKKQTIIEAEKARYNNITLIAVGVGSSVDEAELQGIANKPSSQFVFRAQNFNVLNTLQASLAAKTCNDQGNTSITIYNGTESGTGSSAGGTNSPGLQGSIPPPVIPAAPAEPVKVKKAVAPGSSAGAFLNCFFCPPEIKTLQTGTGTGTGSTTGNSLNKTTINNGTALIISHGNGIMGNKINVATDASGTGSSVGGTTAPQTIISSTLATNLPPAGKRSKKSATSASAADKNCEFFCPSNEQATNSQQTSSPTTSTAPVTNSVKSTNANQGSTKVGLKSTPTTTTRISTKAGPVSPQSTTRARTGSTGVTTPNLNTAGPKATTERQIVTGSTTGGNGVTTATAGSTGGSPGVVTTPISLTTDDLNVTSECRDLIDCRPYPHEKICPTNSTYRAWAEVRCQVYCSFCDPHTSPMPCVDQIPNCNEYGGDLCTNPLYRLFREDNCEKFCGLCKDSSPPVGR